eukprot:COSAG06_NODE_50390_length_319_cov_0.686364_2_plen_29_part_01
MGLSNTDAILCIVYACTLATYTDLRLLPR